MSLIFVPLAATTMGTLPNEDIGNASGLYNLMRNVGGSIGIAVVNTMLVRHEQVHRSDLVYSFISGASHTFQQQYQAVWAFLSQHADAATASLQAYKLTGTVSGATSRIAVVCGRLPLSGVSVPALRADCLCHEARAWAKSSSMAH